MSGISRAALAVLRQFDKLRHEDDNSYNGSNYSTYQNGTRCDIFHITCYRITFRNAKDTIADNNPTR